MPAKKKSTQKKESTLSTILKAITDGTLGFVKTYVVDTTNELLHKAQDVAYQTGKTIAQYFFAGTILFVGFVLVIISLVLLLQEHFDISLGFSFLIWGLVLLIIGLIYNVMIQKNARAR
jgi:FtsH-binding integral membrane protein